MPPSMIPFDVISIIVQLAYDKHGKSTLQACAQVSQVFRTASCPIIFRKVQLTTGDELVALDELLSSDPAIGSYVDRLVIQPRATQPTPSPATWLSEIPRALAFRLQRLRCMELVNLREMGDNCDEAFFIGCTAFSSVETVVFRDAVIELHLLYAFACAFPNLVHLTVGNIRPILAHIWPYPPQLVNLSLTSATLDVGHLYRNALPDILVWLGQTASANTLRSLTLTFGLPEVPDVGLFLEEHGALIEELSLHVRDLPDTEQEFEETGKALNMASCIGLRCLTLREFKPMMLPLLAAISPPHLQELRLTITAADLVLIAERLEAAVHLSIRRLIISYNGPLSSDNVSDTLQAMFSETWYRDILQVVSLD